MKRLSFALFLCAFIITAQYSFGQQAVAWIPDGSTTRIEGNRLIVNPASGYTYLAKLPDGKVQEFKSGTICCDCVGNGSCLPVKIKGHYGCVLDGCSSCNATKQRQRTKSDRRWFCEFLIRCFF